MVSVYLNYLILCYVYMKRYLYINATKMFSLNVDEYLIFNCNVLENQLIKVFLRNEHSFQVCASLTYEAGLDLPFDVLH